MTTKMEYQMATNGSTNGSTNGMKLTEFKRVLKERTLLHVHTMLDQIVDEFAVHRSIPRLVTDLRLIPEMGTWSLTAEDLIAHLRREYSL